MNTGVLDILRNNNLSITDSRKKILEMFQQADGALAHADIEKKSKDKFDRVTIYRTLQTFEQKGIIHTIPTADNAVLYALCKEACTQGHHQDNHLHFICDNCNTTYCLNHIPFSSIKLPKGFIENRTDIIVSGICNKCN